jgi:hypothetical protein
MRMTIAQVGDLVCACRGRLRPARVVERINPARIDICAHGVRE